MLSYISCVISRELIYRYFYFLVKCGFCAWQKGAHGDIQAAEAAEAAAAAASNPILTVYKSHCCVSRTDEKFRKKTATYTPKNTVPFFPAAEHHAKFVVLFLSCVNTHFEILKHIQSVRIVLFDSKAKSNILFTLIFKIFEYSHSPSAHTYKKNPSSLQCCVFHYRAPAQEQSLNHCNRMPKVLIRQVQLQLCSEA